MHLLTTGESFRFQTGAVGVDGGGNVAFCCAFVFALFTAASGAGRGAHARAHTAAHTAAHIAAHLGWYCMCVRVSASAPHTPESLPCSPLAILLTLTLRDGALPNGFTLEEVQVKKKRI